MAEKKGKSRGQVRGYRSEKKNKKNDATATNPDERFNSGATKLGLRATTSPAARARLLAQQLVTAAELLEGKEEERLRGDVSAQLQTRLDRTSESIFKAWLAFHGLDEKRHERLTLVEAIKSASEILELLDEQMPRRDEVDDGREAVITELARTFYAMNFPKRASRIDTALLTKAIALWPKSAGRPKSENIGKWAAINMVAMSAGLPSTAPGSIKREWLRHAHELGLRKSAARKTAD